LPAITDNWTHGAAIADTPDVEWRDLRMGVMCEDLGALTTARARD